MPRPSIPLNPRGVARLLGSIALFLVLANLVGHLVRLYSGYPSAWGLPALFSLDRERNIPTVFNSTILLFSSLLLAITAAAEHLRGGKLWQYWAILSVGFFLMSADEAVSVHERLNRPSREILGLFGITTGDSFFSWVIFAAVLVTALAIYFARFLMLLPPRTRAAFIVAGAAYVSGAVGVESLWVLVSDSHPMVRVLTFTTEEALELTGIIAFIWALLDYMGTQFGDIAIDFRSRAIGSVRQAEPFTVPESPQPANPAF